MRRLFVFVATVALMGTALAFNRLSLQGTPPAVRLVQLSEATWADNVPDGKEIDAIYGDYVLSVGGLTAIVAQPLATRNANMTTRDIGGGLIDLTTGGHKQTASFPGRQGGQPAGRFDVDYGDQLLQGDQLTVFLPGRRNYAYRQAQTLDAKTKDGRAWSQLVVSAESTAEKPEVRTTYGFDEQSPGFLRVATEYINRGDKPLTVTLEDEFRADGGKEEMSRTPNGTVDRFWLQDRFWQQAYALETAPGRRLQLTSDARTTVIKYVDATESAAITIAPGKSETLVRWLTAGDNLPSVLAACEARRGQQVAGVWLNAQDHGGRAVPLARLEVFRGNESLGTATANSDGLLSLVLPVGDYMAKTTLYGQTIAASQPLVVTANEEPDRLPRERAWPVGDYNFGTVEGQITYADDRPVPCKVEFRPRDANVKLDFGPETAEFGVRNLRYVPLGGFEQRLPAGTYDVVISHGPEFDIVEQELTIKAHEKSSLAAKLVRSVDTTGWVSSDFHSHSSPSGDNSGSQLGRVLNLAAEHIEFAPCTEHNRVSTYLPHIQRLGLAPYMATVEGIELTGSPLPLNHQNAFPMKFTPRTQDGGGPTTATNLEDQIERLAKWDNNSEKLLQVNHPDLGWMFYDKDGDGKPDVGHERGFPFMDVIEIHPIENALRLTPTIEFPGGQKYHNTVFRWLQLLNQGFRSYGVVNTDAHYNFHGSGSLRNWIQSSTDQPAEIKPMEMVHASEQGRLVMSNGPFLEVWATAGSSKVTAGQDLAAKDGKVSLKIRVQCPNWLDVDRVYVLVNGRQQDGLTFTREANADAFRSTVVKFDRTVDVALKGDAHVIVVTGHPGRNLRKVYGGEGAAPPAAMTNPIFVDVDGNGFQANKDTLDTALPVKFGAGG